MMTRTTLIAALLFAALLGTASVASAQTAMHIKQSQEALDRAKTAYNDEKYEEAAALFALATQIDPGATHTEGAPYRNLARCLFWLQNYDKAVFWYDVYLSRWPKASDNEDIKTERDAANGRRSNPERKLSQADIYDRSLLELVDTLNQRLKADAPAYTADGGGTTRLYRRAIELGYTMPELAQWSTAIRAKLLEELEARWTPRKDTPLPSLDTETLDVSRGRLANLRTLAPTNDDMTRIMAWQRFVDAWGDYHAEKYDAAAGAFIDAASGLPELSYLSYASGLAHLRAGQHDAALATLRSAAPGAPAGLRPYYDLLQAEALIAEGRHQDAAELYLRVARAQKSSKPRAPIKKAPKEDSKGAPKELPDEDPEDDR